MRLRVLYNRKLSIMKQKQISDRVGNEFMKQRTLIKYYIENTLLKDN